MGKRLLHLADVFWVQFSSSITGWLHHGQKANITARSLSLSLQEKLHAGHVSLFFSRTLMRPVYIYQAFFSFICKHGQWSCSDKKMYENKSSRRASGQLAFAICPFKLLLGLTLRTSRRAKFAKCIDEESWWLLETQMHEILIKEQLA